MFAVKSTILAAFGKLASERNRYATDNVRVEESGDSVRLSATDTRILIDLKLPKPAKPSKVLGAIEGSPNGATTALIPGAYVAKCKKSETTAVCLSDNVVTIATAVEGRFENSPLASIPTVKTCPVGEGKFPPFQDILGASVAAATKGEGTKKISVSARRMAQIMTAIADILDGDNDDRVDITIGDPRKPIHFEASTADGGALRGLLMPMS